MISNLSLAVNIIVWSCVFAFVVTLLVTIAGLINIINVNPNYMRILIYALIIEVVMDLALLG